MTFSSTRRQFLQASATSLAAASLVSLPRRGEALEHRWATVYGDAPLDDTPLTDDPRVKQMLQKGIDSAVAVGASYADMRLTHTRKRELNSEVMTRVSNGMGSAKLSFDESIPRDFEEITVGARALVKGYWGFASGPVWTVAEGERLGREAARQAKVNSLGKAREMSLAPVDRVNGSWATPVKMDPFSYHPSQLKDIIRGIGVFAVHRPNIPQAKVDASFQRQDKAFCSSTGSYFTQRRYEIVPEFRIHYHKKGELIIWWPLSREWFTDSAQGFEIFDEQRLRDSVDEMVEELQREAQIPQTQFDIGRYETVLDASTVATFLQGSIGAATELDRALGYEANATGTSYLNDPIAMLGTEKVASPLITVTADRSRPKGLATVQWDDEAVVPMTTSLITNGVLTNYQTNREGAAWVAANKPGTEARSSGGTFAPAGVDAPMIHTANLELQPGSEKQDFDSLVRSVKKGIALKGGVAMMDFQQANGFTDQHFMYEIVNGKIVGKGGGLGVMFRSSELWKGIKAIGSAGSGRSFGAGGEKGEPVQRNEYTVTAVPVLHESLTYIDLGRKA